MLRLASSEGILAHRSWNQIHQRAFSTRMADTTRASDVRELAKNMTSREILMKIAVLAACIAGIALTACRREEPAPFYEPMKLGSTVDRTAAK